MKTKRHLLALIALIAITPTVFLNHVASAQRTTININKMVFARDPNGQRGLTMFESKDHVIYCIVGISNPSADVKYKFVWSYYNRAQNQRQELFTQDLDNQTTNEVISKFSSSRDLAAGSYTVDIYIDSRKRQSRSFYV
jgi:outer membrane usher protein FimD/PapC